MIASIIISALSFLGGASAQSQSVDSNGCLRLIGSNTCPAFAYAYVHPQNLSNAWPWLAGVTTVAQFDSAVNTYFSNPDQWQATEFVNRLQCNNASGVVIQYERSRLCSNWVNSNWGRACTSLYNGSSVATSQKMICQETCLQYADSAKQIVNNTQWCGPDTSAVREANLLKDYVDCTNWLTLATNDTNTCILGSQNEGNCGFGSSLSQLCNYCKGNNPASCCYNANVVSSTCGFELPVQVSSSSSRSASATSSSSSATSSASTGSDNAAYTVGNTGLTGGQLAGTIVGSILGGLLILGLLFLLFLFCLRKKKKENHDRESPVPSTTPGTLSTVFGSSGAHNESEKRLIGGGKNVPPSTPTMNGDTLYGKSENGSSLAANGNGSGSGLGSNLGLGLGAAAAGAGLGAAAGAGAAGGGGTPGDRSSGVVLPRVKDENQSGDKWIETGAEVTVLWPYAATLPDELELKPGMKVKVLRLYDDAWGTGEIVEGPEAGRQGAFPVVCVSEGSNLGSSEGGNSSL